MERIYSYLDVDPSSHIDLSAKYNTAYLPRFKWLYKALKQLTSLVHQYLNPFKTDSGS